MRSFVFMLGFHEDFAIRRLASKAAQRGEPILVLTAKPAVGAVQKAYSLLRELCRRVGLEEPSLAELDDGERVGCSRGGSPRRSSMFGEDTGGHGAGAPRHLPRPLPGIGSWT